MKFRSAYSDVPVVPSSSGERYHKQYTRKISPLGVRSLEACPPRDSVSIIEASARGVTPADLMQRSRCGDPNAIPEPLDSYMDLNTLPQTFEEAQTWVNKGIELFKNLPAKVRARYNNDLEAFVSSVNSGEFSREFFTPASPQEPEKPSVSLSAEDISNLKKLINGGNN